MVCSHLSKKVVLFMDNNSSLWGKKLNDILIAEPESALKLPKDVQIIIANEMHYEDIRKQLIDIGIEEKRLHVFA